MRSTHWMHRITLAALLASLLAAPPVLANTHDELAEDEWQGKAVESFGVGGGGAAPAPTTGPAGGTSSPGTPTPGDGEGDGDGTTTDGTPTPPEHPPEPESPPPTTDGDDDVAPPTSTPPPPSPPPPLQTELSSCNARWVINESQPQPHLHTEQTSFTNVIFRSDQYAFLCNGYARSESSIFLDWGTQRTAGHSLSRDYAVTMSLVSACANCAPRVVVTGNGKAETKAKIKVLSFLNHVSPRTFGIARATSNWGGVLSWKLNSSAAAYGGVGGADSSITFGSVKIGLGAGGTETLAQDGDVNGNTVIVFGSQATQMVSFWGGSSTGTYADMENAQAKGRTAQSILMQGVSKCGPTATFDLSIEEK